MSFCFCDSRNIVLLTHLLLWKNNKDTLNFIYYNFWVLYMWSSICNRAECFKTHFNQLTYNNAISYPSQCIILIPNHSGLKLIKLIFDSRYNEHKIFRKSNQSLWAKWIIEIFYLFTPWCLGIFLEIRYWLQEVCGIHM